MSLTMIQRLVKTEPFLIAAFQLFCAVKEIAGYNITGKLAMSCVRS